MSVAPPSRAGRPRDPATDRAITEATIRVLARVGYGGLTIESVADEAGVGRPTIYRRHATKADLVEAALQGAPMPDPSALADLPTGVRPGLRLLLGGASAAVEAPGARTILGSLLAEADRDPRLLAAFAERAFRPHIERVRGVLTRGVATGEVALDADIDVAIDLAFGALLARSLLGARFEPSWLDGVVDMVLAGIRASGASREPGAARLS